MTYSNSWLLAQLTAGKTFDYLYFWGHSPSKDGLANKSCLSQWYASGFEHEGRYFATAEHWMMWHKALTAGDEESAVAIFIDDDPRRVKAIGRNVRNYDDKKWAAVKYPTVVQGNVLKFGAKKELKDFLLGTGNTVLVEASPYDKQWGIGLRAEEARALDDPAHWQGTNLLGWALMEARDQLAE